jgi:NADH-quinone oxidoreductase subunit M
VQRIWFNRLDNPANEKFTDLTGRELAVLTPLVLCMLWMGVYPKPFMERMEVTLIELLDSVERRSVPVATEGAPAEGISVEPAAPRRDGVHELEPGVTVSLSDNQPLMVYGSR